ncbi:HNH endonuclease [Myroides phaeus]|uniref:5-methylcytosine-specific restriction enzyme A n=1 Tax=Myroides phaeus TaxID=702745 RepID=A0A1G8FJF7_9FLAO|nr:HNH endonuclease [Myroides phaeus]SDH82241.1 5-methylcytosine-specific restriction enzyme A [Myroides phaeus]
MTKELSTFEWIEILQNPELTNNFDLDIFQALYAFENHQAPASQIGKILGFTGKNTSGSLNLEIGRYAKRIAKNYDINFTIRQNKKYKYWDIFFNGWDEPPFFIWQLKDNLKTALEETCQTDKLTLPEELDINKSETYTEGIKKTIIVNSYERNPKARKVCIEHWKAKCVVCNFDFEKTYGELGKDFIHVHHLKQISEIGIEYQIDPINDLRPVCPNCHSMIHKTNPPLKIEDLKAIIKDNS